MGSDTGDVTSGEEEEESAASPSLESSTQRLRKRRFNHQDLFRESHHHYLFEDIKKQRAVGHSGRHAAITATDMPVSRTTRRSAAAAAAADRKSDSGASSTASSGPAVARMNVGPAFQIPQFPVCYLEVQSSKSR